MKYGGNWMNVGRNGFSSKHLERHFRLYGFEIRVRETLLLHKEITVHGGLLGGALCKCNEDSVLTNLFCLHFFHRRCKSFGVLELLRLFGQCLAWC